MYMKYEFVVLTVFAGVIPSASLASSRSLTNAKQCVFANDDERDWSLTLALTVVTAYSGTWASSWAWEG